MIRFGNEETFATQYENIVPREGAARVLQLADEHLAGELERLEQVRSGKTIVEVQNLEPRIAEWRAKS